MRQSTLRSLKAKMKLMPEKMTDEDLDSILNQPIEISRLTCPEYGEYKREQNRRKKAARIEEPMAREIEKDDVYQQGRHISIVTGGNKQLTLNAVFDLNGYVNYTERTEFQERINNGSVTFLYNKRTGVNIDQYVVHAGDIEEPKKPSSKTKSRFVNEDVTVDKIGSGCIGMMGPETPFAVFKLDSGEEIWWHSPNVRIYYGGNNFTWGEGDKVHLRGFVRESTGRLFNVRVVA